MMKTGKFLLLKACLVWITYTSSAQVFKNSQLTISKLEEHVWVIETTDMGAMYLIEGETKAMLIDTGTKCDSLDRIVEKITHKPIYVVITHVHPDHAGNIRYFKSIYMHPADTILMKPYAYTGKINFINEGDMFDLGGIKIEVSHMPAHTPGSIVLLDKKSGSCYSGDSFGAGEAWLQVPPTAPIKTYINSCKKMEKLMETDIQKIYYGHYPYTKKPFDKNYITSMRILAEKLENNTAPEPKPYPVKLSVGTQNPMITTLNNASIVFDPDHIR